jgi:hypothetical protein
VAPVEGYTLLGVSTTRDCGVSGTIGQFGSGSKHAINTLLRAGLKLVIYCGKTKLEFTPRNEEINDGLVTKTIERVVCNMGGTSTKTIDLGFCLDFGAIDWKNLSMALREFVANAIDRTVRETGGFIPALTSGDLQVAVSDDMRAKDGYTRVYVEINSDVQRFYGELPRRFLHFASDPTLVSQSILPKDDRNLGEKKTAMIYKEGVFVREIRDNEDDSLADYNFHGNELHLDESRNSSEYDIQGAAAQLYRKATAEQLVPVWVSLLARQRTFESTFNSYHLATSYGSPEPEQCVAWQKSWLLAAGPNAVLCDDSIHTQDFVQKKGYSAKAIDSPGWVSAAQRCGIQTSGMILDHNEIKGRQIIAPTTAAVTAVDTVWSWVEQLKMSNGKDKPRVACFQDIANAGSETHGYYQENVVYLKEAVATAVTKRLLQTALEEVAHHITGAQDASVDLQKFAFQLVVELAA